MEAMRAFPDTEVAETW